MRAIPRVAVLRAAPGGIADIAALAALGVEAIHCPLSRAEAVPVDPAALGQAAARTRAAGGALLLTSTRAVTLGLAQAPALLDAVRALPVWCVGPATARAAAEAGLDVARTGRDGLTALLADAPPGPLLWLAGEPRSAAPPDREIHVIPCYRMAPLDADRAVLAGAGVWLVHSVANGARAAALLPDPADRARIAIAALSPAVAAAMGPGWARVVTPETPDAAALVACAVRLCQGGGDPAEGFA